MNWHNERVVIYGGGGFLGSYIVEQLLKLNCAHIKIFNRSPRPELAERGVEVVRGDIRDRRAVAQAASDTTIVFHTAAKAGVWGKYRLYYDINVRGTENVLQACRQHHINTLVYTSSPSVAYRSTCHSENITEDHPYPTRYLAHYPQTKALAERLVLNCQENTISTVALRPHLLWGPRDPHLLPRLVTAARQGKLKIIGDGRNRVDLTYIENAAYAHILAAEYLKKQQNGCRKKYFISDGTPVLLWEWINNLLAQLNISAIKQSVSYPLAYLFGAVVEPLYHLLPGEPPITRFTAGQLAHSHYFDITAARRELGYQTIIEQETALQHTVDWLREKMIAADGEEKYA